MQQTWTLHIERLGRIGHADIALAPLICIVGDNNSGKSYLTSVLWGILSQGMGIFPTKPPESQSYLACEKW